MSLRGHRIGSAPHVPIERFLIIGIDSQQFALSADLVQGLLTMEEGGFVNTLMVQGLEYPSLDLRDRLGLAQVGDGPETRMVLLAQAGIRACIRVDQIHGLVEVERTSVLPLPRQFRSEERNWYVGLILYGEGVAVGLHSMWLLSLNRRLPLSLSDRSDRMRKSIAC
ncbi:MAG: chemotaxis protein CheW [Nitrospira sp.]|mgnify:CR=1 FL=1|nr:chemotaxis protein CheW [Nitrospira sp.]